MVAWWLPMMMGAMGGGGEGQGLQSGQSSEDFMEIQKKNTDYLSEKLGGLNLKERLNPALDKMSDLGKTMGSRNTRKAIKSSKSMFMAMRRAAQSAGIMSAFMEVMKSFLIMLEPFIPIFELLAGIIEAFLTPSVIKMTESLGWLYQGMADLIPVMQELGGEFNVYEMLIDNLSTKTGTWNIILGAFGTSLGDVVLWIAEATSSTSTLTTVFKGLDIELDDLIETFEEVIKLLASIVVPTYPGIDYGDDDGDDDDDWDWWPFANEGVATKPTKALIGEKEPEGVFKISTLKNMMRADPESLYYQQELVDRMDLLIQTTEETNRRIRRQRNR